MHPLFVLIKLFWPRCSLERSIHFVGFAHNNVSAGLLNQDWKSQITAIVSIDFNTDYVWQMIRFSQCSLIIKGRSTLIAFLASVSILKVALALPPETKHFQALYLVTLFCCSSYLSLISLVCFSPKRVHQVLSTVEASHASLKTFVRP